MSLIVARKNGTEILIVGDTKLTFPETSINILTAPPQDGIIKSVILNEHICISFACDDIRDAEQAIRECRKINDNISKIISTLQRFNETSENSIEFILCISLGSYSEIYEIRQNKAEKVPHSWIGSLKAYSVFQEKLHEWNPPGSKDPLAGLSQAMDGVIKSGKDESVSGFSIAVSNQGGFFEYVSHISMVMVPGVIKGNHTIGHGSAAEGGYTLHVFPSKNRYDVLAIHILQGNFGILYEIKDKGLLKPNIINDVDEIEFSEITEKRFGIKPFGFTSSVQKSHFSRGNKFFVDKNYLKAIEHYEIGLKQNDIEFKPSLHFNKGLALLNLKMIKAAISEFDKAVILDKNYEIRVKKVLFGNK